MVSLFGFSLNREQKLVEQDPNLKSFSIPDNQDGAVVIQSGSYYGTYVDLDGIVRNEIELITRYREMAIQPELETAIDDIVNEAIVPDDAGHAVTPNMDELKISESLKKKVGDEFNYILKLLNFGNMGQDIFRRWYIDGRLFYHVVIDEANPSDGIKEIRYIDPRRIRKIREIQKTKDPISGMEVIKNQQEYYLYNERGVIGSHSNLGTKIAADSIVNVNSSLMDAKRAMVLSFLHKAIKPLNQLRMIEDATVIYRLSRAPERRIFYIDVGNMSTIKAEQYLRDIMVKYRNKLVYNSQTGEIQDDRKFQSMLEDIWLPRREGSAGTKIETLPGGENLGQMADVEYFQKKLYKALNIPISRLDDSTTFSFGRGAEITRDELKFSKFIMRLRNKFSELFDELMRIQLVLKKIATEQEWREFKEKIWYDYKKDINISELKETELLNNRLLALNGCQPYVGLYFSREWIRKNVLHQTDEDIIEIDEQIAEEGKVDQAAQQQLMASMPQQPQQGMLPPQQPQATPDGTPVPPNPDGSQTENVPPSKFQANANEIDWSS